MFCPPRQALTSQAGPGHPSVSYPSVSYRVEVGRVGAADPPRLLPEGPAQRSADTSAGPSGLFLLSSVPLSRKHNKPGHPALWETAEIISLLRTARSP